MDKVHPPIHPPQHNSGNTAPATDRGPEPPKRVVPAAARAARLLDTLTEAREPVSLVALTSALGLPKSTVHGLCTTLVHAGLVPRFENGTYHLGLHVMDFAHAFLARIATSARITDSSRTDPSSLR